MAKLLKEKNGEKYFKEVRLEDSPADLKGLMNETRWEILRKLAERPRYPAEIASELGVHEQKVYYHIRELEDSGMIEVSEKEEKGGAVAKYYTVSDYGYALELPYGDEKVADFDVAEEPRSLRDFLHPFISNGSINSEVVVGSPDQHGPHQVRSRDAHLASDLGMFLGQYGSYGGMRTREDVEVKAEEDFGGNMVVLGGPLTNMVTARFNPYLPVKFDTEKFPFRSLKSEGTGKEYSQDSDGFVAKTPNPDSSGDHILVLAGVRLKGTEAAVMALTEHHDRLLEDYEGEDKWAAVVRGKDMDGDGEIDEIEILE
ncbi:MAG: helix-turn-helix domain-containing protein [Candidatus Nanohaloarchaea archaeon]|nr:helix-turn-helix domain-containing protein [Candidatus Nanohaloarchaea archaeon]